MTTGGLGGKTMSYDAENRPRSVTTATGTSAYVYAATGTRLTKTETVGGIPPKTTTYIGPVEVTPEGAFWLYPLPNIKIVVDATETGTEAMHTDQLGSVRVITRDDGTAKTQRTYFPPFGKINEETDPPDPETHGFIGERFDAVSNLQYLNARYYDPDLGMFIQPDWFEVTMPGGVGGTNRYSYSFNDPVNKLDPNGNACLPCATAAVGAIVSVTIDFSTAQMTGQDYTLSDFGKSVAVGAAAGGLVGGGGVFGTVSKSVGAAHSAAQAKTAAGVLGGAAGAITGTVTDAAVNGEALTVEDVVTAGTAGGAAVGVAGAWVQAGSRTIGAAAAAGAKPRSGLATEIGGEGVVDGLLEAGLEAGANELMEEEEETGNEGDDE